MVTLEKRQHTREETKKNCILRPRNEEADLDHAKFVETLNTSKGGIGIIYNGEELPVGHWFSIYIEDLNVMKKLGEVVWIKKIDGNYFAGLEWI